MVLSVIHSSLQHRLLCVSDDADTTYQDFEVIVRAGKIRMYIITCIVLLVGYWLHCCFLRLYLGNFNARHSELGDVSPTGSKSGRCLLQYIRCNHLTHSRRGTLDLITVYGLVATNADCSTILGLFSDHVVRSFKYTLSAEHVHVHHRVTIIIPPEHCPTYITYTLRN